MTWKAKATPAGRQYCQLAVSASRTNGIGCGLWPTAQARDFRSGGANRVENPERSRNLNDYALWATPKASEAEKDTRTPQGALTEVMRGKSPSLSSQTLSLWATPSSRDWKDSQGMAKVAGGGYPEWINCHARSLWLTPSANEDAAGTVTGKMQKMLTHQAKEAESNGLNAQMEKAGQLNVEFVCWLMGYSTAHLSCMRLAMQSYRKLRRNSSNHQEKA
jgi:hypothetical protein